MASTLANQTIVLAHPQDSIEQAAVTLDKFVTKDNSYDDLSKRLRVYSERSPNESGLNDHDYPCLFDERLVLPPLPEVSLVKRTPLPNELMDHFARMQCNCMMGLFPEIYRAWLTIDSDVFVWNYETGGDLAYFDGLNETILSCGLVKPKPGIFQTHISHLLVLTTPVEVLLLGVTFMHPCGNNVDCDPSTSDMHLLPEPLYSLQSDNIHFLCAAGTSGGRIFLGARDGCVYEIIYQAEDSWFNKKCRKVNLTNSSIFSMLSFTPSFMRRDEEPIVQIEVDESRNAMYTRTDKGGIQVYTLGAEDASKVAEKTSNSISNTAAQILKTVDKSNFENIIHIAIIDKSESLHLHLVAITAAGVRLYFTIKAFSEAEGRVNQLTLVHVRLPPGFSASTTTQRPSRVHIAHYHRGNMLMASSQTDDVDLLWTISPDCFPFQSQTMEAQASMAISGHTWALTEEPTSPITWTREPGAGAVSKCNPPLVVTQHMESLRRFVLLSAQGSYIMHKLRPVDQLRMLLVKAQGYNSRDVESFFKLHKFDQACATCLILVCSQLAADTQVTEWATGAFFMYGGEPGYNLVPRTIGPNYGANSEINQTQMSFHPSQVSTPHPNKIGGMAAPETGSQMTFSGKHDGIYLYLGRILGPLWESKLAGEVKTQSNSSTVMGCRVSSDELSWFIDQLSALMKFMESSSQYLSSLSGDSFIPVSRASAMTSHLDDAVHRKSQAEAVNKEKQSLQQLTVLLRRCLEILHLLKIVCDHQFHVVTKTLTSQQQIALKTNTLKSLLSSGSEELFSALIDGVMKQYLGDNVSTDAISARLRDSCPSLYSLDDAKCSKASEILQSIIESTSREDRQEKLTQAMQLYKEVSPNINLISVCEQLANARHYGGILDLCLTTAHKRDPQDSGLYYYKAGEPADDQLGHALYGTRLDCYSCILDTFKYLMNTSSTNVYSKSVPNKPGPPSHKSQDILTAHEADHYVEMLYRLSVKSQDELYHIRLYDWMINNNLTEELLQISSSYIESYLVRSATASSSDEQLTALDILWRYYEKNKNFSSAAKILAKLAERRGSDLQLPKRIEYISRAIMSAKSATSRADKGEFLNELEEKLDVARIQLMVYETMAAIDAPKSAHLQQALSRLNQELLDLTAMYGEFADPYDLAECKLAILHCAGHYDTVLIETLWAAIIDREFEITESQHLDTRMLIIQKKIVSLARRFSTNDKFFPLVFLAKELEMRSLVCHFDDSWVYNVLRESAIPLLKLLDTYEKMYKAKDPCWRNSGRAYHLLLVICNLLQSFVKDPSSVSSADRYRLVTKAQDSISGYLVELQSSISGDDSVSTIASRFRDVRAQLNRMIG